MIALLRQKSQTQNAPIRTVELKVSEGAASEEAVCVLISQLMAPFKNEKEISALIDTGAFLKGRNQFEIGKSLLAYFREAREDIQGIRFYINDEIKVLLQNGTIVSQEACGIPKERLFTFYDNSKTIGADIPQPVWGKAICTLDEGLFHKDLTQGAARMRRLMYQQNILYAGTEEWFKHVKSALEKQKEEITVDDILSYTAQIQGKQQADDVYHAAKAAIPATVRNIALGDILKMHVEGNFEGSHALFNAFDIDGIFSTKESYSPWEQNCEIDIFDKPYKVLEDQKEKWMKKIKQLHEKYAKEGCIEAVCANTSQALASLKPPKEKWMPPLVNANEVHRLDCAVHVEKQKEQQKQTEIESETDRHYFHMYKKVKWENPFDPSKERKTNPNLFKPIPDLFKYNPHLTPFAKYFDAPVFVTTNHSPATKSFPPFSYIQKPFNHVMVEAAKDSGLKFHILDEKEINIFRNLYLEKVQDNEWESTVWLYGTGGRMSYAETCPIRIAENYENNPVFKKAMIQIRLLNAEVEYTMEDQPELFDFIRRIGPQEFYKMFMEIAKFRGSRQEYKGSVLEELVQQVAKGC